ncbi:Aminopeptidase N [Botrimarina colliarenosi]|uniref:Aminopeptidase N n=1 Tax=Botrimarina colliarenosi TaxID=2528001 RepID=A0A5C6AC94_9BACT|nr:M1 family aminopeptidase [Botrimarina colliarenosi]TWT95873.1 Aminopeptidase N [Botrimarina colliarenosi]
MFIFRAAVSLVVLLSIAQAMHAEHVCRYCQAAAAAAEDWSKNAPQYAPDRVVDVRHIKIDVTPDFAAKSIRATTTIDFAPIAKPTRLVELNAVALRIEKVSASRPLAEHSSSDERLQLLFAEPIPAGEVVSVAITYTVEPKKGLYFRTADMGYPAGEDHLWTQGETHEAPHWFPCFDYPNERSTTEVICHVPAGMTVLSNGRRVGEEVDDASKLKTVHWLQDKPHVNYLVCLCAGYFHGLTDEAAGVPLGFYTQPGFAKEAADSFQDTAKILEFYESEIGVAYPWDKYDQVTIRDYNWGGMENTSLTTLTHETIFAADQTENIRSSQGLDAHELAHQWFGDYVTCKDWSHLWLNEGFATYYTHLYAGHKEGRDALLYGLWIDAQTRVLPPSEKDLRPIVHRRYAEPWDQFDFRAYPKGSWVLHMLRSRVGDDLYRQAIRLYLERHALSSVVTDDLRQAFEEVSGKPLDAFFDQWVYHGGVPKLTVSHKWLADEKLLKVTVEQESPKEAVETLPFTFPVMLRVHVGAEVMDRNVEVTDAEQDFYLTLPGKPDVVRFDPLYTVLADVKHKASQEMLEKQLQLAGDLVGRLRAAAALGEKENKEATAALAKALQSDAFYGVRNAASEALAKQGTAAALDALLANREQDDARVRLRVVKDIASFFDAKAEAALRSVASDEKNPDIVAEALHGLAKYPDDIAAESLVAALQGDTFQNQLAVAAVRAIGRRRDPSLVEPLLEALRSRRTDLPGRRYGEALPAVGRLGSEADDTTAVREFLTERLQDPVIAVRLGAIEALGELGDRRARPLLSDLAEKAGKEAIAAKKSLGQLDAERVTAPVAVKELREQIDELREQHENLREKFEQTDPL